MKNIHQESKRILMRQYHRNHPWRLDATGHYIPHDYSKGRVLSWWDDVGFILNGRRVMVWWIHPRMKYADAIEEAGWTEAGKPPNSASDFLASDRCIKQYKRLGRARKKVIAYKSSPPASETTEYYDRLSAILDRNTNEGIDFVARPSMSIQVLNWCTGIELCLPVEVLNDSDAIALAGIVRQMLKTGRSLANMNEYIPSGYQYGREQWLAEADARIKDREARSL